jgi:hypothetical protein
MLKSLILARYVKCLSTYNAVWHGLTTDAFRSAGTKSVALQSQAVQHAKVERCRRVLRERYGVEV